MSDSHDPLAEIRASFFLECDDLLEAAQDGLQLLLDEQGDADTVNAVFRAVHSIKGGAGAFSLDQLVAFAHRFETVLDEIRSGRINADEELLLLFMSCCDQLSDLVRAARDGTTVDSERLEQTTEALIAIAGEEADDEVSSDDFAALGLSLDLDLDLDLELEAETEETENSALDSATPIGFRIEFAPAERLYSLGNEPLFLFRALSDLGKVTTRIDTSTVSDLTGIDLATASLIWHLTVETSASQTEIEEIFDFVEDLSKLELSPFFSSLDEENDSSNTEKTEVSVSDPMLSQQDSDLATTKTDEAFSPSLFEQPAKKLLETPSQTSRPAAQKATVRVDLDRIDRLVNLVGELVINQAMLSQSVAEAGIPSNSPVSSGLEEFMQLTRDIQDGVMMIRAQPVKSLFQRMSRIVREAASDVGKTVRLKTEGEATEIDKTVIERLADPLTHMIRNSLDHGLEPTKERIAAGKPECGTVTLKAGHRSGRVVIEIGDDGGGIDRPRVLEIATKKGLVAAEAGLSDSEIDNLLFMPGFSTAKELTNLSGRGVGMDVVRSAIQGLGGRITIYSEKGIGTVFSISLPLTLAVLDGMVVNVAEETLVVPLNAIVETITLEKHDIQAIGPSENVVQIRGAFVPLLDLGAELGYRRPLENYISAIVLIVAQEDGNQAALVVDSIQDQRQVVIKGLQDSYGHVPGVAAATILGDGQIALIIDPSDVILHSDRRTSEQVSRTILVG